MKTKIYKIDKLIKELISLRKFNKKIVFTNGCFDILHVGHLKILKEAKKSGDVLIVGLNSDNSIKKLKGNHRPIIDEKSRSKILEAIEYVDYIILFNEITPENLIKKIRPSVLVKGGDYKPKEIVGYDFVKSYGGKIKIIPLLKGWSSSSIVYKLINQ